MATDKGQAVHHWCVVDMVNVNCYIIHEAFYLGIWAFGVN
jgi:hypothetical protein